MLRYRAPNAAAGPRPANVPLSGTQPSYTAAFLYGCSDVTAADHYAASSRASSSAESVSSTALAESWIVSGREEPGIGMTTGALASIQARQTCCGLTPCALPTSANAPNREPSSPALKMPPSGGPGQEGDAELRAQLQLRLAGAERG